jgi:4-hydroxy-tetrahydrodipicolinate synthase
MVQFVQAIQQGNLALAQALNFAIKPLMQAVSVETNPIPIKHLMHIANLDSGHLRLPLTSATKASQAILQHAYDSCKHTIEEELFNEVMA